MHYETNQAFPVKKVSDDIAFVDKLINLRGITKMLLFFTIQLAVLAYQVKNISNYYIGNSNFWDFFTYLRLNVVINYAIFGFILLLFFAFYLGKELRTRKKEKAILFSFKLFILSIVFLVVNLTFLYFMSYFYFQVKTGGHIYFDPQYYYYTLPDSIY